MSQAPAPSPTVRAWELGSRLRRRREQLGMTAVAAGRAAKCTQAYVSGVEAGKLKITAPKLDQLMAVYDIDDHEAKELQQLREEANQRAWWHDYFSLLGEDFVRYLGFEAGAEHIRIYQSELIHGLLQTADYARALIGGGAPHIRLTEVDRRVESRLARSARLTGKPPLRITALMSQAALLPQVGGAAVMRDQLQHLVTLMRSDTIDIRVIPFSAGAHPALGGPFDILSFASPSLPDLVWQEIVTWRNIIDHRHQVTEYVMTFEETAERALSPDDSADLIRQVAKEMT